MHYLVIGLAADGQTWLPSGKDFLVPVKPLGIIFRAKFRHALRKTDLYDAVPAEVWAQNWVAVGCQPVGSGVAALKYLAPYIFRVALSSGRIRRFVGDKVTFCYKDSNSGDLRPFLYIGCGGVHPTIPAARPA